jgi:hypothetical protein
VSALSFHPSKKKVGVYFNDGGHTSWIQATSQPDAKLVAAVMAAETAFWAVYLPESSED